MSSIPTSVCSLFFAATIGAVTSQGASQDPVFPRVPGAISRAFVAPTARGVLFDQPGDGRVWAAGATYKASFGADGFVYTPFLGSAAPRNYPVRFVLRKVLAGGRSVRLAAVPSVRRDGARVTLDRGSVREVYDLTGDSVEQTFVIADAPAGDIEVELDVVSELEADRTDGVLQFANALGAVRYGSPFLVHAAGKTEVASTFAGGLLSLRVPAAVRKPGAVVIDPVITTKAFASTQLATTAPDIAYDADTDRWLVTWAQAFSANDHDVMAELRSANGDAVPGSLKPIDVTGNDTSLPRTANLGSVHRFLIAMERLPQSSAQVHTIWGRTMDARSPFVTSNAFEISPASTSHQTSVDVGGDPGTFGNAWTVVWVFGRAIYARQVFADGQLGTLVPVAASGTSQRYNPEISLSNGHGLTGSPGWCVVYMEQTSASDWDIWGATLAPNATILTAPKVLATGATNDLYPMVSSATDNRTAGPLYMVSYERQQPSGPEMVVQVVDRDLKTVVPEVNLTRRYGYSGTFCRVETDGVRFVATCRTSSGLAIGTLAMFGNDLVQHESLQTIGVGGEPFVASKRSGGGGATDYGICYVRSDSRVGICLYEGRAATGGFNRRGTGCGLWITPSGRPALGDAILFTLGNVGSEPSGLVLGLPIPAVPLCPSCGLGVDLTGPTFLLPSPFQFTVPREPTLVGSTAAVQGFAFGSGNCPGSLRVSDTIDVSIQ